MGRLVKIIMIILILVFLIFAFSMYRSNDSGFNESDGNGMTVVADNRLSVEKAV